MAIKLSEGFSLIPVGTHVFQITEAVYKETFGKIEITLKTAKGQKHIERFSLVKSNGELNEGALNAFSFFAKTALNDFSATEIEPEDLVGHFIRCEVDHEKVESNKTPGKYVTFIRLGEKSPADGFDEPVETVTTVKGTTTTPTANTPQTSAQSVKEDKPVKYDLSSILG